MAKQITITTDDLGLLLATSLEYCNQKEHDANCSAFRWLVFRSLPMEDADKFYDEACEKAREIINQNK